MARETPQNREQDRPGPYFMACLGCMWYIAQLWDYSFLTVIILAIMCLLQLLETSPDNCIASRNIIIIWVSYCISLLLALMVEVIIKHHIRGMSFPLPLPLATVDASDMRTMIYYLGFISFIAAVANLINQEGRSR